MWDRLKEATLYSPPSVACKTHSVSLPLVEHDYTLLGKSSGWGFGKFLAIIPRCPPEATRTSSLNNQPEGCTRRGSRVLWLVTANLTFRGRLVHQSRSTFITKQPVISRPTYLRNNRSLINVILHKGGINPEKGCPLAWPRRFVWQRHRPKSGAQVGVGVGGRGGGGWGRIDVRRQVIPAGACSRVILLVEKVYYREAEIEILAIIPLQGGVHQLPPLPREGQEGGRSKQRPYAVAVAGARPAAGGPGRGVSRGGPPFLALTPPRRVAIMGQTAGGKPL